MEQLNSDSGLLTKKTIMQYSI